MVRKFFDIFFGILLFILTLPLLIIFSLVVLLETRSFPIFSQERGLTLDKYRFKIYKIKTIKDSTNGISHLTEEDIFLKPTLKEKVSPFSRWLRKTGLDELPQLVNVLLGQMSIIGPRPLMLEDLKTMKRISPELYSRREQNKNKPGISGLWQLFGNRDEGIIGMVALESLYEKVASPFLDFKLVLYTTSVVFQAKNSDSIFFTQRANPSRVKTIIDSSSKLKVTLNMPEGIAKFIVEKVEKHEGKYTVEIPSDWWYVSDSYKTHLKKDRGLKILPFDQDSLKKTKKNAS